jgi:hypothetical protein
VMSGGKSDLFGNRDSSKINGNFKQDSIHSDKQQLYASVIRSLPSDSTELIKKGGVDITHPRANIKTGQVALFDPKSNLEVRIDKAILI